MLLLRAFLLVNCEKTTLTDVRSWLLNTITPYSYIEYRWVVHKAVTRQRKSKSRTCYFLILRVDFSFSLFVFCFFFICFRVSVVSTSRAAYFIDSLLSSPFSFVRIWWWAFPTGPTAQTDGVLTTYTNQASVCTAVFIPVATTKHVFFCFLNFSSFQPKKEENIFKKQKKKNKIQQNRGRVRVGAEEVAR